MAHTAPEILRYPSFESGKRRQLSGYLRKVTQLAKADGMFNTMEENRGGYSHWYALTILRQLITSGKVERQAFGLTLAQKTPDTYSAEKYEESFTLIYKLISFR